MAANDRQVGGSHYKGKIEHWDYVWSNGLDYFQGQITKYVSRWKKKSGIQDLYKAKHFLEKYIELIEVEEKEKQSRAYSAGLLSPGTGKDKVAGAELSAGYPPEAYGQTQAGMRNRLDPAEKMLRDGWKNT